MNYYNIYIENYNDTLTSFQTPEDDLTRLVESYDNGDDSVYINGEQYILKGLKTIKVFDFNEPWDKFNEYLNSQEARKYHTFSRDGYVGLSIAGLAQKGQDLTRTFFKNNFGWKKNINTNKNLSTSTAKIDINFIPNSREYLKRFVLSHYKLFFDDMGEFHPQKGYGQFPHSSEIVQCMREITHITGDVFSDLSIPEKFNSPTDLIHQSKQFIDHLESFESYFIEAIDLIKKKDKEALIPMPITEIDKHRRNTIDVFKMFVQLAQKELSDKGQITLTQTQTDIEKIENLLRTFHNVAIQLLQRRNEAGAPRQTLKINDEYDVQDLLCGLLKIHFLDIRAEEWTPSYAGSSKRSDFLLKNEKIIIEVKKTRAGLKDKEVGEQLIIDIANYKKHTDCKTLICFVYDPEKMISNPRGIENDLKETSKDFTVLVFILP